MTMATAQKTRTKRSSETVLPSTTSKKYEMLEYSIHTLLNSIKRDLVTVFPGVNITRDTKLLLVTVFQKSNVELLSYGDAQASEKDRLLERFFEWSDRVRDAILTLDQAAWVEVTDPASGVARWGPAGGVYSDVEGMCRTLRYDTMELGGCRILKHPTWGFSVYPSSLHFS